MSKKSKQESLDLSRRHFLHNASKLGFSFFMAPLLTSRVLGQTNMEKQYPDAMSLNGIGEAYCASSTGGGASGGGAPGLPFAWQCKHEIPFGVYNPLTGNANLCFPICQWPGIGEEIEFALYFNSQADPTPGPCGVKWRHVYQWELSATTTDATITSGTGTQVVFTNAGNGSFAAPTGIRHILEQNTGGAWTMTKTDGTQYGFDPAGKLTGIMDSNGQGITCTYSSGGSLTQLTDAAGKSLTLNWSGGNLVGVSDYLGNNWVFTYSGNNLASLSRSIQGGLVTSATFGYDAAANVSSVTEPLGSTWAFTYGAANNLTGLTDPEQHSWSYSAALSQPVQPTQSRFNNSSSQFKMIDAWPLDVIAVRSTSGPNGQTVSYGYDSDGRATAVAGNPIDRSTYAYDVHNNLTQKASSSGAQEAYTYDSQGRCLTKSYADGGMSSYTYDAAGNLASATSPLGNTVTYAWDSQRNLTGMSDSSGIMWSTTYNAVGLPEVLSLPQNRQITVSYDISGNVVEQVYAGHSKSMEYSGENMTARVDELGRRTEYQYNSLGRLSSVTYPSTNAPAVNFSYDASGRITQRTDANGVASYSYNPRGLVTAMSDFVGNVIFAYDATGNLLQETDGSGRVHNYTFDTNSNITSASDGISAITYSYDSNGYPQNAAFSNGISLQMFRDSLDAVYELRYQRSSDGFVPFDVIANYNASGGLLSLQDTVSGATTTYSYNALGQLVREERQGSDGYLCDYSYNGTSQRASAVCSEQGVARHSGTYIYNSNGTLSQVIDSVTTITEAYNWDASGNLTSFTGPGYLRRLNYDEEQRLVCIQRDYGGGNIQTVYEYGYTYGSNALSWRKDYILGIWAAYSYSLGGKLLAEMQRPLTGGAWVLSSKFQHGQEGTVLRDNLYYHTDLFGFPAFATDVNGDIVSTTACDTFGVARSHTGSADLFRANLLVDEGIALSLQGGCARIMDRDLFINTSG